MKSKDLHDFSEFISKLWAQDIIFGYSWYTQKLVSCQKVATLPKNVRVAKLQPLQINTITFTPKSVWWLTLINQSLWWLTPVNLTPVTHTCFSDSVSLWWLTFAVMTHIHFDDSFFQMTHFYSCDSHSLQWPTLIPMTQSLWWLTFTLVTHLF